MEEVKVTNLIKTYGDKTLFNQLSFQIHSKDRIGLIGPNGTGKTSLLTILAGKESSDGDQVSVQYAKNYRIGYLSQNQEFDPNLTVLETVFQSDTPSLQAVRNYELALQSLAEDGTNPANQKKYNEAEEWMNKEEAWSVETEAKIILQKLGIDTLHRKIGELSGGQSKRIGLAQALIEQPDLLLLDEPTNHLDYSSIQWLGDYLKTYRGALLMVTHDRYFLDQVTTRILELSFGQIHQYKGNYETYLLTKAERERISSEQEEKRKQLYKKELEWVRAGVRARGTKQQARRARFDELKANLHQVSTKEYVEIDLVSQRLGKKVIEIRKGNYQIANKKILKDFDLLIQARDRIGITGANGIGKSTLLNLLAGRLSLDGGTYSIGETVKLAYYTQQNEDMDFSQRIISYLQESAEQVKRTDGTSQSVVQLLEQFLFPRSMHGVQIGKLSGGEKRRLYLLKLLVEQPNVLLLDEPTNDLDIDTLTILEEYIRTFPGAVIAVSHDRYFLDKTMEKLLIFTSLGMITTYQGAMSDFLSQQPKEDKNQPEHAKKKRVSEKKNKKKMTYLEQKEWKTIEHEIDCLEAKATSLSEKMTHQGADFTKLQELQAELVKTEKELDEKVNRWEYLSSFLEN